MSMDKSENRAASVELADESTTAGLVAAAILDSADES